MKRPAALAVVLTLFLTLVACKSGGAAKAPPPSGATVPTAAPTTTTTNPYAVPATIDAAYVNRVLAGLDAVFGDAYRLIVGSKNLPPEAIDRLKSIYGDLDLLNLQLRGIQEEIRFASSKIPANPGNKKTTVRQLLMAQPTCVYARVGRDYSEFVRQPSPERQEWIALRPLASAANINGYNPTGWAYIYEGSTAESQAPPSPPCTA